MRVGKSAHESVTFRYPRLEVVQLDVWMALDGTMLESSRSQVLQRTGAVKTREGHV